MIILKRLLENEAKAKFKIVKDIGHNSKKYLRMSYARFMNLEDLLIYPSILVQLRYFHQELECFILTAFLAVNIVLTVLQPK